LRNSASYWLLLQELFSIYDGPQVDEVWKTLLYANLHVFNIQNFMTQQAKMEQYVCPLRLSLRTLFHHFIHSGASVEYADVRRYVLAVARNRQAFGFSNSRIIPCKKCYVR